MVMVHILATTNQHAKNANGKIFLYIIGSTTDHDHHRLNVKRSPWLSLNFDNETSCFKSLSGSKKLEVNRLTQGGRSTVETCASVLSYPVLFGFDHSTCILCMSIWV